MTQQLMTLKDLKTDLDKYASQSWGGALPSHVDPMYFSRVAYTYVAQNPRLLQCDKQSLYSSFMTLAQLGLAPEGVLGQAYIVPFKGKAQPIVGYKGLITLARNSGEISTISARTVYENDKFAYEYGLEEKLVHVPADGMRGAMKYVYAIAKYRDGGHNFVVLSKADVDKIRDQSEGWKAYKSKKIQDNPWATSYEAMAEKTAIRKLNNVLPKSVQRAVALEEGFDRGKSTYIRDGQVEESDLETDLQANTTGNLNKRFAGKDKEPIELAETVPDAPPEEPPALTLEQQFSDYLFEISTPINVAIKKAHMEEQSPLDLEAYAAEFIKEKKGGLTLALLDAIFTEPSKFIAELVPYIAFRLQK